MAKKPFTHDFTLEPEDTNRIAYLIGPEDSNLSLIEKRLNVSIAYSGSHFQVRGSGDEHVKTACRVIQSLYTETEPNGQGRPREITSDDVNLSLKEADTANGRSQTEKAIDEEVGDLYASSSRLKVKRGFVRPRTSNQTDYVNSILRSDVCFGIGPAGTGKTYLAVASAVDALERNLVRRIILTRPAVEAGEKLGFLPGDLTQKVDPYLRPLYDALFEMLGFEKVEKLIERQVIEIAPLAYMRGRTLNDSFIILDEAQNTTIEQMKMFLTRIGFNSKAVITGDPSQTDLPKHVRSGLRHAIEVLENVEGVAFSHFGAQDVVRHPVVAAIVTAYNAWDRRQEQEDREKKERKAREKGEGLLGERSH